MAININRSTVFQTVGLVLLVYLGWEKECVVLGKIMCGDGKNSM